MAVIPACPESFFASSLLCSSLPEGFPTSGNDMLYMGFLSGSASINSLIKRVEQNATP
jgi:hypothetical protein